MTRVAVAGDDQDDATSWLVRANQLAASSCESLGAALGRTAAMAGGDATSARFAAGYDDAARLAVGAHAELADAWATAARLADRCADNHADADAASAPGHASPATSSAVDALVGVTVRTPPSSAGGSAGGLPDLWDLVVDQLQGWAWPDADCDRLRDAASAWRRSASRLRVLAELSGPASAVLARQRSPEVSIALEAVEELERGGADLARVQLGLARACDDHADAVEAHRDSVRGILETLGVEVGVSVGVGVGLSFVTLGGGAVAGSAVVAVRSLAAAHRIVAVLRSLRAATDLGPTSSVTSAADDLARLRLLLARFDLVDGLGDVAVEAVGGPDDWQARPRLIEYTWDAVVKYGKRRMTPMEHIREGHWPDSALPRKGHFLPGITEQKVMDYVEEAVRRGTIDPDDSGTIVCDLEQHLGTTREGTPTTMIRLHIREGIVRSAYPFTPRP